MNHGVRRRLLIVFIFGFFMLCGCSSTDNKNTNDLYYLEKCILYNNNSEIDSIYEANRIGSHETSLSINQDIVICKKYYHNELIDEKKGSMKNGTIKLDEDQKTYVADLLFEGDSTAYRLIFEYDDKDKIQYASILYKYNDYNYLAERYSLSKLEEYNGQLENIILLSKSDFENSEIYKSIYNDLVNNETNAINVVYDSEGKILNILMTMPKGASDDVNNGINLDKFESLCDSTKTVSQNYHDLLVAYDYDDILCKTILVSDKDSSVYFYISENGNESYKRKYSNNLDNKNSNENIITNNNSTITAKDFESEPFVKDIKDLINESLDNMNPSFKYDKNNKTFTCMLSAPRGTVSAINANNKDTILAWTGLTINLDAMSSSGYSMLCENGYDDTAFIIMVSSDEDSSKCIYATMNGVAYYDILYN